MPTRMVCDTRPRRGGTSPTTSKTSRPAANTSARGIIEHNKGEAISAFDDPYWRRYYHQKHGWLQDMIDGARDMAKSLDQYADAVHHAVKRLEHAQDENFGF
ncbi:hypothetical protein [Streptomyces sp. NBC_01361]|uniref:hypothetical protein n=1 Tax=Streptomyces sp. NBC_01361 TaxID=2903838 RepID=UPI002E32BDC4|nr:hypothetical protein [Streptomyces sp. NBC_01361]